MSLVGFGAYPFMRRCSIVFIALLAVALPASAAAEPHALRLLTDGASGADSNDHAWIEAESRDGARVVFTTTASMAASDTDTVGDLYARTDGGAPVHLTDNPSGSDASVPAYFEGASADARYVYFESAERLLATDTDESDDLYAATPAGALVHVSERPVGADEAYNARFRAVSDDGLRAVFQTEESLSPADGDTYRDIYELGPAGLRLVSEDSFGIDDSVPAYFEYASPDGARVYFSTEQTLAMSDEDEADDVYMSGANGAFIHVSDDGNNPDADRDAYFIGEAEGGERVWFETDEQLAASDADGAVDVYERAPGGALAHVSDGSPGPDAQVNAYLQAWSADGSRLFVETVEQFSATDTDLATDVYRREADGSFLHLSDGAGDPDGPASAYAQGVSDDGSTLAFLSAEPLAPSDTDALYDVYLRTAGGALVHVSDDRTGPDDALEAGLIAISDDGSRLLLTTQESLTAADGDGRSDIYLWAGGELTNVSDTTSGADAQLPVYDSIWSSDLTRVYFFTAEPLVADDTDVAEDGYLAFPAPVVPGGGGGGAAPTPATGLGGAGDATPPQLSGLRVLPKQLERGGAAIRFSLSEPSRVQFTVRSGKRVVGGFARAAAANANRFRFPVALTRRLSGGKFELRAVPRDAAGNLGVLRRVNFTTTSNASSKGATPR